MSIDCYKSGTVISTAKALRILGLKVSGVNSDSNVQLLESTFSKLSRLRIFTGKILLLTK
jgi:hypothetical protein